MLLILSLVVLFISFFSCEEKETSNGEDQLWYGFPSLVDTYYTPKTVSLRQTVIKNEFYADYPCLIMDCVMADDKTYSFDSESEQEKNAFEKYATFFGDTLCDGSHIKQHYASVLPVISIEVTADRQFDRKHPVDSLLNDILYLYVWRDYRYEFELKRTYDKWYNGEEEPRKPLDSISADNPVYMLPKWFRLHFKKNPDTLGTYNLTITMKFGADPVTGETVEIDPIKVQMEFK